VEKHEAFLALCATPLPLRTMASEVGVALSTAFRWRHAYLEQLQKEEEAQSPSLSGMVVAVSSNVCSRGERRSLSSSGRERQLPAIASFPAFTLGKTHAATVTHLVQCCSGQITTQLSHCTDGWPARSDLGGVITQHAVAGTRFISQFGQGIVTECQLWPLGPATQEGANRVKWQLEARAHQPVQDWRQALLALFKEGPQREERNQILASKRAAARLKLTFRRWMRSFRGIALRHVRRYTAWFNTCWRQAQEALTQEPAL